MRRIADTLKSNSAAVIGMCKNAGKTTVLNAILRRMYEDKDKNIGVTSVGRDGELCDVVTGTKKPSIFVHEGTIFATACELVSQCDVTKAVLDTTDISTPMGNVVIMRAMSDGNVQLAGPSTVAGVVSVNRIMRGFGATHTLCDGALSRKTLSMPRLCDEFILCSGASYSSSIDTVVHDTAYFCRLFLSQKTDISCRIETEAKYVVAYVSGEQRPCFDDNALASALSERVCKAVFVNGAITDKSVLPLIMTTQKALEIELIAEDAGHVLLTEKTYLRLINAGIKLGVTSMSRLCAVAVNPYSVYGASFDRIEFIDKMNATLSKMSIPVFDVSDER